MFGNLFRKKMKKSPFDLTPEQDKFLASASEEYNKKMLEIENKFSIYQYEWHYSQETGVFQLIDERTNSAVIEADGQIIGTYFKPDGTWEWAWSNPGIEQSVSKDSNKVREYGKKEKLHYLYTGKVDLLGEETFATYLAAVGLKICCYEGVYRGDTGDLIVYILFKNITKIKC